VQEGAPFKDGWREFLSSLPWTSYVLVALALLDVCLVWAYCGWSVNRPGGSIEESLHIALALAVWISHCHRYYADASLCKAV
jgi:hypothetical protein